MHSFFITIMFSFPLCVARDSNVFFFVIMWSPRQQYVFFSVYYFFQFIIYFIQHITCFYFISLTYLTMFLLFFIFNMFHFNCCLNKIFVIVIVNYRIEHDILFNPIKSVCAIFKPNSYKLYLPTIFIG